MSYQKLNTLFGWITFAVAATVYVSTIEPTASFWDCGEFIATAFKLEVGHPPGAPFFMLLGRFFTLFSFGDVTKAAMMVNILSALASAATIMFLYWTITHMARRFVMQTAELTPGQTMAVIGSGLVGSFAYTFSDTFWFSAVEGEVYALSSLFTALVFWAILKWENVADDAFANRWLILIAYLMGLSIGVHLLNLLAIPAIVLIYYFRKYPVSIKGLIYAFIAAVLILGSVMYIIIPGVVKVASVFELALVNGLGMPFSSGLILFIVVLIATLSWAIYITHKKRKILANTIFLGITCILLGYSTYALIVIRSSANPPIDQNNPDNVFDLLSYLNREQYGDRPLVHGQYYNAPVDHNEPYQDKGPIYAKIDGKYKIIDQRRGYNFDPRFTTLFPRMYSSQEDHIQEYKSWGKIKGIPIRAINNQGEEEVIRRPTFSENLRFFFVYQLNHMYFRYFMWNYAGRQNDIQGHGGSLNGNWISGITALDEFRLGPQDILPVKQLNNRANNKYYLLPLLLGIAGLVFQSRKDVKNFWVVLLLFFFTGIAIVIYLNQYPIQPRERDYAYAGSFYAFAIWIGFGVYAIYDALAKKMPGFAGSFAITMLCLFLVPGIMASENWDDHDRSHRTMARDFAANYLNSCEKDAILFTNGDNDTFPLWYAQEVEGIRTDVRIACLPYLSTDWYIDQLKSQAYDSKPAPISMTHDQYITGKRDMVPVVEKFNRPVDLKEAIAFLASEDPRTKIRTQGGEMIDYFPARTVRIPVDAAKVIANGIVKPEDSAKIVKYVEWKITANYLAKNDLMILDILATSNWERPVYFVSAGQGNNSGLKDYFRVEGFAYRFVPIKVKFDYQNTGLIDADLLYDRFMNTFKWGGIDNPKVYLDENNLRTLRIVRFRTNFSRLADELILAGKIDSAKLVLEKCVNILPDSREPFNYFDLNLVESFYKVNLPEKANEIAEQMAFNSNHDLMYYMSLRGKASASYDYEQRLAMAGLQGLISLTEKYKQTELNKKILEQFNQFYGNIGNMLQE